MTGPLTQPRTTSWMPALADDRELAHRGMVLRDSRPIPKCHPDRPIGSKGLCGPCYQAQLEPGPPPLEVQVGPWRQPDPPPAPVARHSAPPAPPARTHALHPRPTPAEIAALLAVIEYPSLEAAADRLGLKSATVRNQLADLYHRIGARTRPHAAWLLWPQLGTSYVLPGDARRRRVA